MVKGKEGKEKRKGMSERPVPRRESPWGTPEGEDRQPKAHRCNDRAEDVIQVPNFSLISSYYLILYYNKFFIFLHFLNLR